MSNVNTQIYDKVVDRTAMLRYHENELNAKIGKVIDVHQNEVSSIVRRNPPKLTPALRQEIENEVVSTYAQLHSTSSKSLLELVNDQLQYSFQTIDAAIGNIWRTAKPARRVSEEIVLERPIYSDTTLAQGWKGLATGERKRIEQIIRRGVADGKDEIAISKDLLRGNAFNISKSQSQGLARTAMTSVYSQADHEVYKANAAALRGWQYVAVLDSRTTPLCAARDGKIFEVGDIAFLPPAHWHCRSTTTPVVKSYEDFGKLDNVAQVRKRNLDGLSNRMIAFYDGQPPLGETYNTWLLRQPVDVQLRHLGDYKKLEMLRSGQLTLDKFVNDAGKRLTVKELRQLTDSGYALPGDTVKFAGAKERLDAMRLGVSTPEDLISDVKLQNTLRDYYLLQSGDLDGILSVTNYRGTLIHTKKATKTRVLSTPPTEDQLKYNPLTGSYEDVRLYQPAPNVLLNSLRLVNESDSLKDADKTFINSFIDSLETKMSVNERAVVAENLRIVFTRYRTNGESWSNFKAVLNSQIKFDVMNVSDAIETQLRKDTNVLHKLKIDQYVDPVLGPLQLQQLHDEFLDNIHAKNRWEDSTALKIGRELRNVLDYNLPIKLKARLSESQLRDFYTRFAQRLSVGDTPDRDQMAIALGRDPTTQLTIVGLATSGTTLE